MIIPRLISETADRKKTILKPRLQKRARISVLCKICSLCSIRALCCIFSLHARLHSRDHNELHRLQATKRNDDEQRQLRGLRSSLPLRACFRHYCARFARTFY